MDLAIHKLGLVDYERAYTLQKKLLEKRQQDEIGDTLLLLEHPPVITLGKRGRDTDVLVSPDILAKMGVAVCEIERGGEATYHGPGQIVGYMFIDLAGHGKDIRRFIRNLEEVFIQLLDQEYGITAGRDTEHTGVWVGDTKITAIGIAIRKGVTMHGFAFNVNTNLDHFKWIVPCGIRDKGVTSLQMLTGEQQEMDKVIDGVARSFCRVYGYTPKEEPYVITP